MITDSRFERKFVIGKYENDFFERVLRVNSFHKPYNDRIVNSIYIDTLDYDFLRNNIDGISSRKKIRIRWYDDNFKNFSLEEKNKQNFLVSKKIKKLSFPFEKSLFKKNLIEYLKIEKNKNFKDFNYKFVLKTNYSRSYWLSNDKKIRATIDTNLNSSPFEELNKSVYLPDTILEFKYSPQNEKYFRNFFSKIGSGLRAVKYSKYVKSFFELNNSGLIK